MKMIFIFILFCIVFISCDSNKMNRNILSEKSVIMVDSNNNYFVIKHSMGRFYEIEYLGDSTIINKLNVK